MVDSLGGTVSTGFDAANRLASESLVTGGATQLTMTLGYNNRDELTSETRKDLVNGALTTVGSTTLGHDDAGRLTNLQHLNGSGGNLANYVDAFDPGNRLTSETLNGGTPTPYTYDHTNQLLSDGTSTNSYDLNGNRTNTGYVTGADNRMSTDGTWTYSYDSEGNTTKKTKGASAETWYYGFDNANHMTSARQEATDTGPTGAYTMLASYVYDAFGNRIEKDVTQGGNTTVSRFAYDAGTIWADLDSGNHLTERRLSLGGSDGDFARVSASGAVGWFLVDHEGSVRDITDNTGAVIDHLNYSTYGAVLSETSPSNGDRMGFQRLEKDPETGFNHAWGRYVEPLTFHWTSQDPLGFGAGDTNLYRPMGNGPTNETDPSGLQRGYNPNIGKAVLYEQRGKFKDNPWLLETNWSKASGDQVYLLQGIDITFSKKSKAELEKIRDKIYDGLRDFTYLNVDNNNLATIKPVEPSEEAIKKDPDLKGRRYGEIMNRDKAMSAKMMLGDLTDGPGGEFYVELFNDDKAHTVKAVTLGRHPIVGIRRWSVKIFGPDENGESHIYIETMAWEYRNGRVGDLGFWKGPGLDVMKKLWATYLENIANAAIKDAGEGKAVRSTRRADGQWDSDTPEVMIRYDKKYSGTGNPLADDLPERVRP